MAEIMLKALGIHSLGRQCVSRLLGSGAPQLAQRLVFIAFEVVAAVGAAFQAPDDDGALRPV